MFKNEFKKMLYSPYFFGTLLILLIFVAVSFSVRANAAVVPIYRMYPAYVMWIGMNRDGEIFINFLVYLLPLISMLAYGISFLQENENNYIYLLYTRIQKRKYITVKVIVSFLAAFFVVFLPLLIDLIMCIIVFPVDNFVERYSHKYIAINAYKHYPMGRIFLNYPYLHHLLIMTYISSIFGLVSTIPIIIKSIYPTLRHIFIIGYEFLFFTILYIFFQIKQDLRDYYFVTYFFNVSPRYTTNILTFIVSMVILLLLILISILTIFMYKNLKRSQI